MPPDLSPILDVKDLDGTTVVTPRDEFVLAENKAALYSLVEGESALPIRSQVVLNLENIRMFRSEMLATLVNFQRKVKETGGSLKLCSLDRDVQRLVELTHLNQVLDIRKTAQEAIDAFRGRTSTGWFRRLFGGR